MQKGARRPERAGGLRIPEVRQVSHRGAGETQGSQAECRAWPAAADQRSGPLGGWARPQGGSPLAGAA